MDRLVDENTKAILITNPSNPCGSSYSREHLIAIVAVARFPSRPLPPAPASHVTHRKHQLPIIADEIYGGLVFNGSFTAIASVSEEIPVISVSGLAKEFIVPGWRVGWVVLYDRSTTTPKVTHEVKAGLKSLSQLILGELSPPLFLCLS
jgi:tyrosine aminotransferase